MAMSHLRLATSIVTRRFVPARACAVLNTIQHYLPRYSSTAVDVHWPYRSKHVARLEGSYRTLYGDKIDEVYVTWEQYGDPTLGPDRTILLLPSFSHGSHACSSPDDPTPGWWEAMIGPGKAIDTRYWRIICPSFLGSPFGATSCVSVNPATQKPFASDFPQITPQDCAAVHMRLLQHLGLSRVHAAIGSSFGGMQVLAFAVAYPSVARRIVAIACTAKTTPGTVALRHVQRTAIRSDPAFNNGHYPVGAGPVNGLRVARQLGMLLYRSRKEFDDRFDWNATGPVSAQANTFEVESYLSYQGSKFWYDANCYLTLSKAMDLMDISQVHPEAEDLPPRQHRLPMHSFTYTDALSRIRAKSLLIGMAYDALIPPAELETVARVLQSQRKDCKYLLSDSIFGHDAFLKEFDWLTTRIRDHLESDLSSQLAAEALHTTGASWP